MSAPIGSPSEPSASARLAVEVRVKPLANRRFLLVTMPAGSFARRFAHHLGRHGADVLRVLLNGGDFISWGPGKALWPRVPRPLWSSWLDWQLFEHSITDVVVFGDSMAYCAEALAGAKARGARTWVLENGYNRPDWITIETTGVNANSCLSRDPDFYHGVVLEAPVDEPAHLGAITPYHTLNMTKYFTGAVVLAPFFPTYVYPYSIPMWAQIGGHIRRYVAALAAKRARAAEAEHVLHGPPFFLACLQRDGDSQLLEHSDIGTNIAFMARVIASFAARAPKDCHLVFKNHPLDPGVESLARRCAAAAKKHKVADRVRFLEGGVFGKLARASRGLVSVNSTAAYAALGFGTPVKLLGRALFDVRGLTDPQPLDTFWSAPRAPDLELYAKFRQHLSRVTQVYGSFHNPRHVEGTAERLAEQLIRLDRREIEPPRTDNVTSIADRLRVISSTPPERRHGA